MTWPFSRKPSRLFGLFTKLKQPVSPVWNQVQKPRLEALEDRFMPAVRTWDGGAVLSNNWSNASNWVSNIAPVAGDDLIFPVNVSDKTADNDFTAGTLFNSITLGGGYTLKGSRIVLGAGGVTDNSGTSDVIKLDITMSGTSRTFTVGAGSTLFQDGKLLGNGLVKQGAGNLSLRANNDYTGLTQVFAGQLFLKTDGALGDTTNGTIVKANATLVLDHSDNFIQFTTTGDPLTLEDGAKVRALGATILNGPINILGSVDFFEDGGGIVNGGLAGLQINSLISGNGSLALHGNDKGINIRSEPRNTYQGTTSVFGQVTLSAGSGDAIPGDLIINSGATVRLGYAGQINDDSIVTIHGTGILEQNARSETIGGLILNGGSVNTDRVAIDDYNYLDSAGVLRVINQVTATSSSTSQSARIEGHLDLSHLSRNITINNGPAASDLVLAAEVEIDFGVELDKNGTGLLELTTNDMHLNFVNINAGTVAVNSRQSDTLVSVNAGGTIAGNGSVQGLTVYAGGKVAPGSTGNPNILQVNGDAFFQAGSIFKVTLNGTVAGSGHDQLDVDGTVTIDNATLEPVLGAGVSIGSQFRIINNGLSDAVVGAFQIPAGSAPFFLASPTGQRLSINNAAGTQSNDIVVTHENTPPKAPDLALNRTTLDEGGTVTVCGHLVDPDPRDKLRLYVNWGDGSRQEIFRPGLTPFSLRHRYSDNGQYVARFEWLDQHGQGNSRSFDITVKNVAPQITLNTKRVGHSDLFFAYGLYHDPGRDQLSATVDFGDGTGTHQLRLRHGRFLTAHRYRHSGIFNITVRFQDDDDGVSSIVKAVSV